MKTIVEQLRETYKKTDWTMGELLQKSGLDLDRSSLRRKISGEIDMKTDEAEVLANTFRKHGFDLTLVWPSKKTKSLA